MQLSEWNVYVTDINTFWLGKKRKYYKNPSIKRSNQCKMLQCTIQTKQTKKYVTVQTDDMNGWWIHTHCQVVTFVVTIIIVVVCVWTHRNL